MIATALVTVPVVLAIVFGARASSGCSTSSTGSSEHKRPLTVYPVTILGVLVIVDAVFALADLTHRQCVGKLSSRSPP